jgi:long-chain acyl-CoA synthetase
MNPTSVPLSFQENGKAFANSPAYHYKENGEYRSATWEQYTKEVRQCAQAMLNLGFEHGDKTALVGFNRPEWCIFNMATMSIGGAAAGIYTTNSPEEVAYILTHTEARYFLLEDESQWEKIKHQLDQFPSLEKIIVMRGAPHIDHEKVTSWEAFMKTGQEIDEQLFSDRINALKPGELATFIYTSGTTGPPKGVMLSHDNIYFTGERINQLFSIDHHDRVLSYLPLSHIAEQLFSIHGPAIYGFQVYFAESIDKLPDNLKEVEPTLFFGVPRIWEKFYSGIQTKLKSAEGAKKVIATWTQKVGLEACTYLAQGKDLPVLLKLQFKLANRLAFEKVKSALGLGQTKYFFSGAAPVSADILSFLTGFNILISEVYGQSEDCGPTTINRPGKTKLGTVGLPYPDVEVRLAEDKEILVKGRNVFMGYYKDQGATDETLVDGWLQSGDLGDFDTDGYLSITGRKKDIIITAGGKNIAPKNIEAGLKDHAMISEAVVIGDRRKFLSALICIEEDVASKVAGGGSALHESKAIIDAVQSIVDDVNNRFARVEHIRKFTILPRPLSIEDRELTPTLKVKRRIVNENWSDAIEAMYASDG